MGMWNISANLCSWEQVSVQIENELRDNLCPAGTAMSIIVAADEIFANISAYAYKGNDGEVEIKTQIEPLNDGRNEFKLTFSDRGIAFNPLDTPVHEKGTLARHKYKSGSQGGFGIHIIRDKADKLSYIHEDEKNVLCFTKFYAPVTSQ